MRRSAEAALTANRGDRPTVQTTGASPRGAIGGITTIDREGRRGVMTAPTHHQHYRASAAVSTLVIVGAWLLAAVLLLGVAAIVFG